MAYLCGTSIFVKCRRQFHKKIRRITTVATEQPPKSPKQFASILRTSLQRCLHQRCNRILIDVEDSVSLDVEKSNARDKTKRELARLLIEMFYGTHIPVKVAFCDAKELQVAQTTWGLSTQWVDYWNLDKAGKRGFQEGDFGRTVAEEQVLICVDPKPQQLSCLESCLVGPGQVVVLVNPRRIIQKQSELLSSMHLVLKRYTAALVLRRYMFRGERCLLYTRFPSNWCLFSFQNRRKQLLYEAKELPSDEQSWLANLQVKKGPSWRWPWDDDTWWFMKDL
ncbi:hypothetical protein GpartN1_g6539.t1 [Galdieria partita]|uniref:DUF1995 domain-containing protein n=1 Tax=Galdieria partita TaxID=83374 RepID=A0A9C7Q1H4_9RHOD|nr:hypothetical protein GpartN1_g6539.t1 [Galdieria partita]